MWMHLSAASLLFWKPPLSFSVCMGVDYIRQMAVARLGYSICFYLLFLLPTPLQGPLSWVFLKTESRFPSLHRSCKNVPAQHSGKGFYSNDFLALKKNGGWRSILDLRLLNNFVKSPKFRMLTVAAKIPSLEPGDWFSAPELQDTCFHMWFIHFASNFFGFW